MAIIKAASTGKGSIKHVVDYVTKKEKTDHKLVTGFNCSADTAFQEMQFTKELHHKTGGRTFLHYVQSFSPDEDITPEEAHKIACQLAEEFTNFQGYEVLIATHLDRDHIHSHMVVNSVGFETGRKFQMDRKGLQSMKDLSDRICKEHGLSICERGQKKNPIASFAMSKFQLLQKAEQGRTKSYVKDTAIAVQECMDIATSLDAFVSLMNKKGFSVDWQDKHKYIVFQDAEGNRVRNSNLQKTFGMQVSKEELTERFKRNAVKHEKHHSRHR